MKSESVLNFSGQYKKKSVWDVYQSELVVNRLASAS